MPADVFEEAPLGFDFSDNPRDFRPQMTRVGFAAALAGDAERLARVARSDQIHCSTPRAAVKGAKVRPNRSRVQGAVFKARRQEGRDSSFPFHETDGSSCWVSDSQPKIEPTVSGAEREDVGRCSHIQNACYCPYFFERMPLVSTTSLSDE